MESLVFAIAGCKSATTAQRCTQAVLSAAASSSIPVSKLMDAGFSACSQVYRRHDYCQEDMKPYHQYPERNLAYRHCEYYQEGMEHDYRQYPERNFVSSYSNFFASQPSAPHHRTSSGIYKNFIITRQKNFSSISTKMDVEVMLKHHELHFIDLAKVVHTETRWRLERLKALNLISGHNVGEIYPISTCSTSGIPMPSLQQILRKARCDLASLAKSHTDPKLGSTETHNCMMLKKVNDIIKNDLDPCVAMLGGFMERRIRIPLVNNPFDTAKAIDSSNAVGVWALFALDNKEIANIVKSRENRRLIIQVAEFIKGVLRHTRHHRQLELEASNSYNAKLQFLLQGMSRTVTCSNQYISYSLERELVAICAKRKITTSTKVDYIVLDWDNLFRRTALVLVPVSHRPLLARWLIWALNIYQLREGLASYTTVGVIGLVNSGKSTLVNKIFGRKASQFYCILYYICHPIDSTRYYTICSYYSTIHL